MSSYLSNAMKEDIAADLAKRPYDSYYLWGDVVGGRPSDFSDVVELREFLATTDATPEQVEELIGYWCENS